MTATERAMAREEWDRIRELEDRVTIDDALLGTLRDRIRELETENKRLLGNWSEADALWIAAKAEVERLRERVRLHELALVDCPGGAGCMCEEIESARAALAELSPANDENRNDGETA